MSNAQDGWLSPNNFLPHIGALNAGYRALMIDTFLFDGDFNASTPDELYACHGLCAFGKRTAFDEFNHTKTWLDDNPQELIVLFMENYGGKEASDKMYDVFETLDMVAVGGPFAHGIARLGCFAAGCCYGLRVSPGLFL